MIPFSPRMGATLAALVFAVLAIRLLSQLAAGHIVQFLLMDP